MIIIIIIVFFFQKIQNQSQSNRWPSSNKNNIRLNGDSDKENIAASSSAARSDEKISPIAKVETRVKLGNEKSDDNPSMKRETGEITSDTLSVKSIGKLFNGTINRLANAADSVTTNNYRNSTATNHQYRAISKSATAPCAPTMPSANEQSVNHGVILIMDKNSASNNNNDIAANRFGTMTVNNNFTRNSMTATSKLQANPSNRNMNGTNIETAILPATNATKINGNADATQSQTPDNEYKGILERKAEWEKRASQTFK